jgi:hypothetical protein
MGSLAVYFVAAMLAIHLYGGYRTLKSLPDAESIPGDMPRLPSIGKTSFLILGLMVLMFVLSITYDINPLATGPFSLFLIAAFYMSLVVHP